MTYAFYSGFIHEFVNGRRLIKFFDLDMSSRNMIVTNLALFGAVEEKKSLGVLGGFQMTERRSGSGSLAPDLHKDSFGAIWNSSWVRFRAVGEILGAA